MSLFKDKKTLLAIALVGTVMTIVIFFKSFNRNHTPQSTLISEEERRHGPCPGTTETIKAQDGKEYHLLPNYYACHEVKRGDLVYLKFSETIPPIVRRVHGIKGDTFKLLIDKERGAWNIKINDEFVFDHEKKPHFFGGKAPPILSLYEKPPNNPLAAKNFIVFSDFSPSTQDSGTLGIVNSDDFLGKIEELPVSK